MRLNRLRGGGGGFALFCFIMVDLSFLFFKRNKDKMSGSKKCWAPVAYSLKQLPCLIPIHSFPPLSQRHHFPNPNQYATPPPLSRHPHLRHSQQPPSHHLNLQISQNQPQSTQKPTNCKKTKKKTNKRMGCAPSRPSRDTDSYKYHSVRPQPSHRSRFTEARRSQRQDVGYQKLTARGKGGVKSSRLNRIKVDEDGVIWYY